MNVSTHIYESTAISRLQVVQNAVFIQVTENIVEHNRVMLRNKEMIIFNEVREFDLKNDFQTVPEM